MLLYEVILGPLTLKPKIKTKQIINYIVCLASNLQDVDGFFTPAHQALWSTGLGQV